MSGITELEDDALSHPLIKAIDLAFADTIDAATENGVFTALSSFAALPTIAKRM
jgi:hypothetical protein